MQTCWSHRPLLFSVVVFSFHHLDETLLTVQIWVIISQKFVAGFVVKKMSGDEKDSKDEMSPRRDIR